MYRHAIPLALLACSLSAQEVNQKPEKQNEPKSEAEARETRRRPRIRFGGFAVGVGYSRWSSPWWGHGYYGRPYFPGYYAWDPFYHPFYYHPYYSSGFGWGPSMGEVKLQSDRKDAEVYVDGAYAGNVSDRKTMWLDPGAYNLEIRAPGKEPYSKRIYVLSGKSLRVNAKLEAQQ
jgi:hypothetical protein